MIFEETMRSILLENQPCSSRKFYVEKRYWKCRFLLVLSLCIAAIFISSCSSDNDATFPKITHLAFQTEENGKWGMIGVDGKVLFEDKVEYRGDLHPSCAVNGVFRTWEFDQVQRIVRLKYYTATEAPKQIGLVGGYKDGGVYSEGIIPVVAYEGRIHYINNVGDTVFCLNPYKGKEFHLVSSYFTEQRAWFATEDYKYGYIDPKGNVVIEPIYDDTSPFHEGKAIVYKREEDKFIAIDVNGNELFEVGANGTRPDNPMFYNGYCVIGNFLCNDKGERIQRMPAKVGKVSSFNDGIALFQDKETEKWQQMDINGNFIGDCQYDRVLGFVDELTFVANTLIDTEGEDDNEIQDEDRYMNVYAIDKKGKVCNEIDNLLRFYPLYENVVISENGKYYFADKNGNPINNDSFYFIDVPAYTYFPSNSCFVSLLNSSSSRGQDYFDNVRTGYFDENRTIASVLDKLTDTGIGKLKIGQNANDLIDEFNVNRVPLKGKYDLGYVIHGINYFGAICSVGLLPPDGEVNFIKIQFYTGSLPSDENVQNRIRNAIIAYLDQLGLEKNEGGKGEWVTYIANQRTYNILYLGDELYLMSKPFMETVFNRAYKNKE